MIRLSKSIIYRKNRISQMKCPSDTTAMGLDPQVPSWWTLEKGVIEVRLISEYPHDIAIGMTFECQKESRVLDSAAVQSIVWTSQPYLIISIEMVKIAITRQTRCNPVELLEEKEGACHHIQQICVLSESFFNQTKIIIMIFVWLKNDSESTPPSFELLQSMIEHYNDIYF